MKCKKKWEGVSCGGRGRGGAAARDVCAVRGVRDAISRDDENDGTLVPVLLMTTLGSYSCALSGQGLSWDGPSVAARVVVVRWRRDATTYNLPPRGWRRNSSRAVPRTIARGAVDDISRGIARARSSVTRYERTRVAEQRYVRTFQEKPNSIPTPSLSLNLINSRMLKKTRGHPRPRSPRGAWSQPRSPWEAPRARSSQPPKSRTAPATTASR